jgi:hypothetical protein
MEPTYEFRKKYVAIGAANGARDERERILERLETIAGATDLEAAVQSLIMELSGESEMASASASGKPSMDTMLDRIRSVQQPAAHTNGLRPGEDMGDAVVRLLGWDTAYSEGA